MAQQFQVVWSAVTICLPESLFDLIELNSNFARFCLDLSNWCMLTLSALPHKMLILSGEVGTEKVAVRIWNPHGHASSHFEAVARQIRSSKVVVENQSGLFHYLSGARAAPGVGQLGKDTFSDFWAGFQLKWLWYRTEFWTFMTFFESTVRHQNLKLLTEHKPAWNHVTGTPAKSQKQQRPLALLPAMVGWTRVLGFQSCSQKSWTTPKPVTLILHPPVCDKFI